MATQAQDEEQHHEEEEEQVEAFDASVLTIEL